MSGEKRIERGDQSTDGTRRPRELPRRGEEDAEVVRAAHGGRLKDRKEVGCVLGDDRAVLGRHQREQSVIVEPAQLGSFLGRHDIMSAAPQLQRNPRRGVLIEEQPHPRAARSRRHAS